MTTMDRPWSHLLKALIDYELEIFVSSCPRHTARQSSVDSKNGVFLGLLARSRGRSGRDRWWPPHRRKARRDHHARQRLFGNSLTALATFAMAYHVGFPIYANTRGNLGEYNSMIHGFSSAVPKLLDSIGVGVGHPRSCSPIGTLADEYSSICRTLKYAASLHSLQVMDSLHPSGRSLTMKRIREALE